MKILIVNIDSKIPNLALAKIEKYHRDRGDEVRFDLPIFRQWADKIYVSCIFTKNRHLCEQYEGYAEIGGTGYDLHKKLPPEIEAIKPHINWGKTTLGCSNKCSFCFVPRKEGNIRIDPNSPSIYDIWDGKSKDVTEMSNNILALPSHFKKICAEIRKEKLVVDFNQGLDIRLADDDTMNELKTIRHKEYHFAWDGKIDLSDKFRWLYKNLKRCTIYVLCGYNSTFAEDLSKFNILKKIGHNGFCMRYETVYKEKEYILLARWVNQHNLFHTHSFGEFLELTSSGKQRKDKIPEKLRRYICNQK
ncbi:MAG: hypothetical protein V1701_02700 [Planctomycetota bacterium]